MDTAQTPEPLRWTRRKQARPGEILDAAMKVFAEKGFAAARMEDIAKRAGVTKGTIYLYFENKETVFKQLVREAVGNTIATVTADVASYEGSARFLLRMVLTTMSTMLIDSDKVVLPKIVIAESANFPWLADFYRFEVIERGLGLIVSLIQRGIDRGEFRPLPPEHVARIFIAPMLLSAIWRVTFAHLDPLPYDHKALIATHLDILFRGLAPDGAAP
ncbi:MAG: TetR/AcrR family transcriptional regulator [Alphaproteobacteria bacterium]|nr:TetR/AcrR family transcriptional regulator [Alphaproteobacteria bacterium]MBL7099763.1 TetR/AcrR family transcriptional regulator [Alphaproteobacteria bacterium]